MNRPTNIATGQPSATKFTTSASRSRRPRNNLHRYLTPRSSVRRVTARATPIGVVPSIRGQMRFTALWIRSCSSSNQLRGEPLSAERYAGSSSAPATTATLGPHVVESRWRSRRFSIFISARATPHHARAVPLF
jgi:hypothetical protein